MQVVLLFTLIYSLYARHFYETKHSLWTPPQRKNIDVTKTESKKREKKIREEFEILKYIRRFDNKLMNITIIFDKKSTYLYYYLFVSDYYLFMNILLLFAILYMPRSVSESKCEVQEV